MAYYYQINQKRTQSIENPSRSRALGFEYVKVRLMKPQALSIEMLSQYPNMVLSTLVFNLNYWIRKSSSSSTSTQKIHYKYNIIAHLSTQLKQGARGIKDQNLGQYLKELLKKRLKIGALFALVPSLIYNTLFSNILYLIYVMMILVEHMYS